VITASEAWNVVVQATAPLPVIQLPLAEALHHVLAEQVCADRDIPSADRAAMDGYAVRASDLESTPTELHLCGEVAAGSDAACNVGAGECVAIFTGANMPPGADTVVMVEDTEEGTLNGERVRFLRPVTKGQHIFRRGENAFAGDVLVPAGRSLGAIDLALCASVGCAYPTVFRRPIVSIITTGAELKSATDTVGSHQIRNSNGPMLEAALAENGFPARAHVSAPDEPEAMLASLESALSESDAVLVTGGVSVGKYDLVPETIRRAGGEICYHGVRIKPGKPQLFALFRGGKLVFGLPGNPLSAMTGMQEFALPALRLLAGCPVDRCRPLLRVPLASDVHTKGGREYHLLARLIHGGDRTSAEPIPGSGSADLVAAGKADGAIIMPAAANHRMQGEVVEFRPWRHVP